MVLILLIRIDHYSSRYMMNHNMTTVVYYLLICPSHHCLKRGDGSAACNQSKRQGKSAHGHGMGDNYSNPFKLFHIIYPTSVNLVSVRIHFNWHPFYNIVDWSPWNSIVLPSSSSSSCSGASGGPVWPPAATGEAIAAQGCLCLGDFAEFQRHEDLDLGCRAAVPWLQSNARG